MDNIRSKKRILYIHIFFLAMMTATLGYLLMEQETVGLMLLILTGIVMMVGLFNGVTMATFVSIFFYFTVGSVLFWAGLSSNDMMAQYFYTDDVVLHVIYWMSIQMLIAIFSGRIHRLLKETFLEVDVLKNEVQTLVAIDRVTGYDNKNRMTVELDLEFNRSKRYDDPFSLLLIKWNYYEQFYKFYGEAELNRALRHLAKSLYDLTRVSDQRFRAEDNLFVLFLTKTPVEHIDIIIEKVKRDLSDYTLSNGKVVTLTFEFGYVGYHDTFETAADMYQDALEQVESNV